MLTLTRPAQTIKITEKDICPDLLNTEGFDTLYTHLHNIWKETTYDNSDVVGKCECGGFLMCCGAPDTECAKCDYRRLATPFEIALREQQGAILERLLEEEEQAERYNPDEESWMDNRADDDYERWADRI